MLFTNVPYLALKYRILHPIDKRPCVWYHQCVGTRGVGKHGARHGHGNPDKPSPTYMTWKNMIARCRSLGAKQFADYGGAGVSICDRWGDFNNFLADMGPRPEGHTLGRVLDRGNYEPSNVFWMTWPEQGLHRRNNNSLRRWEGRA